MAKRTYLLVALLISGCATSLSERHVTSYTDAGIRAEDAGDWKLADRNYRRALISAETDRPDSEPTHYKSMALYNLGRAEGHLCRFEEAERLLTQALAMEEKMSEPNSPLVTKRLFELGRLYLDQRKYSQSVPYLERALPAVLKQGAEQRDPVALADAYDDLAAALAGAGNAERAELMRAKANQIRDYVPGRAANFIAQRYNGPCPAN